MENKNKSKVRLCAAGAELPLVPNFVEKQYSGKKWVSYGEDNMFDKYLYNLYLTCSVHQSIVDGMIGYILGDNLQGIKKSTMRMITKDFLIFGGFALEVIYNSIGEVVKVKPLDFMKCRVNRTCSKVYYSSNWKQYTVDDQEFDMYNPNLEAKTTQIFYYAGQETRGIYPVPSYIGSLKAITTAVEIDNYRLKVVANGFMANVIINFNNGQPTEEEQELIEERITEKFTNQGDGSSFVLNFNDNKESAITVEKLNDDQADEKYTTLYKDIRENILIGWRANGVLFGLISESTGFNAVEFEQAFNIYQKTIIEPIQDELTEALVDFFPDIKINPLKLNTTNGTTTKQ